MEKTCTIYIAYYILKEDAISGAEDIYISVLSLAYAICFILLVMGGESTWTKIVRVFLKSSWEFHLGFSQCCIMAVNMEWNSRESITCISTCTSPSKHVQIHITQFIFSES